MLVDADGHEAQDVFIDAHLALHLGDRRRRRVDVEERVVGLAVLLDAVRERLEPPVLVLGHLAAALGEDVGEVGGHFLDLLGRHVLPRQIDMLVEGHEAPSPWFHSHRWRGASLKPKEGVKAVF